MDVQTYTPTSTTTARATLRVGIIGLGVGEQHIDGYRRHPAAVVSALCDISEAKRDEVRRRHPELVVVSEPDTVLTNPDIDVVSIASWDAAHGDQVVRAIEHGKHVFVEKPLCVTVEQARRIRAALALRPHVRLSTNFVLRHSPRFRLVRSMIAEDRFGEIFHVEGEYNYGRLHKLTDGWRGRDPEYSVVLGGAVHVIDLLLWLTKRRVVEVCAYGNGIASADSVFAGDDMVAALLRFEGGATGTVTANFGCVRPHGHGLTICGTRATFVNDHPHGRFYTSRDPAVDPEPVTAAHASVGKGDLLPGFLDEVLGLGRSAVTADEVFAAASVCFAIDESRRCGAAVAVEYI